MRLYLRFLPYAFRVSILIAAYRRCVIVKPTLNRFHFSSASRQCLVCSQRHIHFAVAGAKMATKHIAHELLSKAHPPDAAATIFTDKVLHKPLHLRPSSPDPNSQDARARRRLQRLRGDAKKQRRVKVKSLSAKERRISGIYDIPENVRKYEIYLPLHEMWLGYMCEILGVKEGEPAFVTANSAGSKLASADYHGAKIIVVRSRCASLVGLAGIVVRDSKFTFQVVTEQNALKSEWL